jgi:type IV pilus assembly protein PilY1
MKTSIRASVGSIGLCAVFNCLAATTDISNTPLEMGATSSVKPNVMLLLDDSLSMAWDFMPDWIGPSPLPGAGVDKPRCGGGGFFGGGGGGCGGSGSSTPNVTIGLQGDPPYYAYQFNGVFYNPNVYYPPGVNYDGSQMTSYNSLNSAAWTRVPIDAYGTTSGTINLPTGFPEAVFCSTSTPLLLYVNCKRNGVDTGSRFLYNLGSATNGYPDDVMSASGSVTVNLNGSQTIKITPGTYFYTAVRPGNPFYYTITPAEYCSDVNLTMCELATSPDTTNGYTNAAPIRYCLSPSDQNSLSAVSGTTTVSWSSTPQPRCQKKYNQRLGYQYPRFGYFNRYDIVPSTPTYTRSVARIDCAAVPTCTYAEEMTNFANWYAYYHVRLQMAKSAVGQAFNTLTSSYRVGFLTINAYAGSGGLASTKFVPIGDFTSTQKQTFYSSFYALQANNSTPLREALSRIGQYYAGLTSASALDAGMINSTNYPDPVQYSCQQNFTIMTTDGYWNGNGGQDLNGNLIDYTNPTYGNQDNDSTNVFEQRASSVYGPGGYYDGNLSNTVFNGLNYTSIGTLADVAMYYYKTDLRPPGSKNYNTGLDVSTDNVPTAQGVDQNPAQHMVTFTIGLGVDGYLTYDTSTTNPSYLSADYLNIRNGTVGACVWTPGNVCDWPQVPEGTGYNDDPAKDDDLWHAAINGRGSYLSAKNPQSLLRGLARDLAVIQTQVGAAAASATSTPNITATNNAIYSTTFRTAYWDGEMVARTVDPSSGVVSSTVTWSAKTQLIAKVGSSSDSRTIYTLSGGSLAPFNYSNLDPTAQGYFNNKCSVLSQCSALQGPDQTIVNSGASLIGYLRGQSQYADGTHFRSRTDTNSNLTNVLGDLVDSRPAVVNVPMRHYADPAIGPGNQTYAAFAAANANRQSVVYVGANDGMLHAFDAATGNELWAYVPRMLLPKMYLLSDISYGTQHAFFVDGSPEVVDVQSTSDGLWHTLLIVGMNDGGRGYAAFDVTNPSSPQFLWEFCNDSTMCSHSDANLGLTFGNPVITKRSYDNKWVVLLTSGYNNVSPGDGGGHLYEVDPFSGAILRQASTGVGSTTTPSGLSRITAMANNPDTDNTSQYVYGGDLQGNLWRFNLGGATISVSAMATLQDAAGKVQSITTRPEVGKVNNTPVVFVGTGRMLGLTDLQSTPPGNWSYQSSLYALADTGSSVGNPRSNATIVKQTFSSFSATQLISSSNPVNIPTNIGWYIDFQTTGERVNIDPQLALGTLFVATNVPNSTACAAGGDSWFYQFNYANGSPVSGAANNVTGTKNVGAEIAGFTLVSLGGSGSGGGGGGGSSGSGTIKAIVTLSNGQTPTNTANIAQNNTTVRRVGWREVPLN